MIYYISDTHFGHSNIIRFCDRPFASAEEMDNALISNWNQKVQAEDTVYVVGDFAFKSKRTVCGLAKSLNGHKHLILGNHDHSWVSRETDLSCFESISNMLVINDAGNRVTLCHYPMMDWSGSRKGAYMVYGHIHNNTDLEFWPLISANEHMLNAGVEINNYTPSTLRELISNNEIFKHRN